MSEVTKYEVLPCVPYQLCPKCSGYGRVNGNGTAAFVSCPVCQGAMVIPMHIVSAIVQYKDEGENKELEYWKSRCKAAEACIKTNPLPDKFTDAQWEASTDWLAARIINRPRNDQNP